MFVFVLFEKNTENGVCVRERHFRWWARDREVAREPESGCRALLPCPIKHARRHARAASCARATAARTAKSFRALGLRERAARTGGASGRRGWAARAGGARGRRGSDGVQMGRYWEKSGPRPPWGGACAASWPCATRAGGGRGTRSLRGCALGQAEVLLPSGRVEAMVFRWDGIGKIPAPGPLGAAG